MDWAEIHSQDTSWRKKIVGGISDAFTVPRYVNLFYDTFGSLNGASFLELGSGNGDMPKAILTANRGQIGRYTVSEHFPEGVEWLKKEGLDAIQADAQALPVPDASYDAVVVFDVMHHVPNPRAMAREMMRAGRGRCLMVESNGLSVLRKLKERTASYRAAGERSYRPSTYRGFFEGHPGFELTRFECFPFLFAFKCPSRLLPALVWFNRWIERVPFFRWQCASLALTIEYRKS
jgi:hypothetical protein